MQSEIAARDSNAIDVAGSRGEKTRDAFDTNLFCNARIAKQKI